MKKIKFAFIGLLFIATLTAMKPLTINIPPGHDAAVLNPPPHIDPCCTLDPVWTIINNSNCTLKLHVWFTVNGERRFIDVYVAPGDNKTITSGDVLAEYSLTSAADITNSSIEVCQGSSPFSSINYFYPGDNTSRNNPHLSTENGCNCVHVAWDESAKTITITNC